MSSLAKQVLATAPSAAMLLFTPQSYFSETDSTLEEEITKSPFHEQIEEVKAILRKERLLEASRIDPEVNWFYGRLGIERSYFITTPATVVARHILSLFAAKMVAHSTGNKLDVQLSNVSEASATFITPSYPGQRQSPAVAIEHFIEAQYLGEGHRAAEVPGPVVSSSIPNTPSNGTGLTGPTTPVCYRVACFRTHGTIAPNSLTQLRIHTCTEPKYPAESTAASLPFPSSPTPSRVNSKSEVASLAATLDINKIGDISFLAHASEETKQLYQEVLREALQSSSPAIRVKVEEADGHSIRLVLAYKRGTTNSFWSAISDLYHFYGLYSVHKYVEQFSHGYQLYDLNLRSLKNESLEVVKEKARVIAEQALSLAFVLPRTALSSLFQSQQLSLQEVIYGYVTWKFAFQFLSRYGKEYSLLGQALGNDPAGQALLDGLRTKFTRDAFTEERILDSIIKNVPMIKTLYLHFEDHHMPSKGNNDTKKKGEEESLKALINKLATELDVQVFTTILSFNLHVLKTNFFKKNKTALSFRLDPSFLDSNQYPNKPFGVFFLIGSEFRGFHVRFRDIARGGVRMIRSVNTAVFNHNALTLFDENYNLASTQQSKNKDIPEGGSKGTILLSADQQSKAEVAFHKYVDALLDLLPSDSGKSEEIVDLYGKDEIVFLGPDEGTADLMDWASQHARKRGYRFWKSFTTGKSTHLGGIPHDLYGMTTRSIHQYVLGIISRLGLNESECTKFQTGGPDGDLGSNEIKISKDKTIGIVDGSGVLYDPQGLNREELLKLAGKRLMARNFDKSKLGPGGFFVDVEETDAVLPDGTSIGSGMIFRNGFHLNPLSSATLFVPCGGRPESVAITNVDKMFHANGQPRFKYVVEGANLFFTQKARLVMEERGVVIFKDASANKGGVTSSSLEVLAALALNDEEFISNMSVPSGGAVPAFYQAYVKDVHSAIELNARKEFDCIWNEFEKGATTSTGIKAARSILSDLVSNKINDLNDQIQVSPLWDNISLRRKVFSRAFPPTLLNLLGLDTLFQRVPENYLKAIFGSYLASHYVYSCGLNSHEFAFYTFIQDLLAASD